MSSENGKEGNISHDHENEGIIERINGKNIGDIGVKDDILSPDKSDCDTESQNMDDQDEDSFMVDPQVKGQQDLIKNAAPKTELEEALLEDLKRKEAHINRLSAEVMKLKAFISKRKQTYKRKRKDEGAPTRALSAYNIFVQDRFSRLAKENEAALKSADSDLQLKRVPPASLVASTGNQWKELSNQEKSYYEERAKEDKKRYTDQMAKYHPPEKQSSRKRNKTGYNMFFSAHVLMLKKTDSGVPSEKGSVARLVGNAWKELSAEGKQFYEREADKENGMNTRDEQEDSEKEEKKNRCKTDYNTVPVAPSPSDPNHIHRGGSIPPHNLPQPGMVAPPHHDPRHAYAAYPGPPMHQAQHPYYDPRQQPGQPRPSYGYGPPYMPPPYPPYHDGPAPM
jgi:hypothetical protein